jgi:WD40 repeat protein
MGPASQNESGFRYWAFISYSHADEVAASRLHRALESYRLPGHLVARETEIGVIPRRLFPIFRDLEELPGSSDLGEILRESLQASRTLIVICSPKAAQSKWVNEEITEFQSLGRSDRVFCVIANGDPGATDAESRIFPDALIGEPLAVDFREGASSVRDVKLRLIAGMVGLGLDELKRRDRQRRIRIATFASFAAAAVLAGIIALSLYGLNQQKMADSRTLAADSIQATDVEENPVTGLELAIEAYEKSPTAEAREALTTAIEYQRSLLVLEHETEVRHASFSANGDRILICSVEPAVRIWSVESGDILQQMNVPGSEVRSCSFSPDSSIVAAIVGGNNIHLWNAATGTLELELPGHADTINQAVFSTDGASLIVANSDGAARVWDIAGGNLRAHIDASEFGLRAASLIEDDTKLLAIAHNGVASIWDLNSQTLIQEFGDLVPAVHSAVISPDQSRLLLSNYQYRPYLWELSNPAAFIDGAMAIPHVSGAAFSADSSMVVIGGGDGFVSVFDATEGYQVKRLQHPDSVSSIAFAAGDQLIVTASDKIRIWDTPVLGGGVSNETEMLRGHDGWTRIAGIAPHNDLHVLTIGLDDHTVRIWDISAPGRREASLSLPELSDGAELLALARRSLPVIGYAKVPDD